MSPCTRPSTPPPNPPLPSPTSSECDSVALSPPLASTHWQGWVVAGVAARGTTTPGSGLDNIETTGRRLVIDIGIIVIIAMVVAVATIGGSRVRVMVRAVRTKVGIGGVMEMKRKGRG
ncbi:hypothetical protein COCNU_13G005100 [Cocos nucifera]|uniref:Uncharacterized protein n=1 Tax=Cocos nucifera TaxID=13894 RepID=A0A8K0NC32_COCNU|nr:hypothetical protein COCNU_13G005100 [Cocos nucifera]